MTDFAFDAAGRRLHQCTVCHRVDIWGPDWQWYGTLDDPPEAITCSIICRAQLPFPTTVIKP